MGVEGRLRGVMVPAHTRRGKRVFSGASVPCGSRNVAISGACVFWTLNGLLRYEWPGPFVGVNY